MINDSINIYGVLLWKNGDGWEMQPAQAVARKLAVLLHKLWTTGQDYHPFYPTPAA